MENYRKRYAAALGTVGGLLLGVQATESSLTPIIHIPHWAFNLFLLAGVACVLAAVLLLIAPLLIYPLLREYKLARAKPDDLEIVHNIGKEEIGNSVITLKTLHEWYSANRNALWIIRRCPRGLFPYKPKVVGFFSVVPINAEAAAKLMKNRPGGFRVTVDSIVAEDTRPAAWYISAVAATGFSSRGITLQQLKAFVAARISEVSLVIAAPTTEDGLKIVRKNRMVATDPTKPPLETIFYRKVNVEEDF